MASQPGKPAWSWALTVLGMVAVVLATGRCGPTVVGPAPDEAAYRQMAIMMDGGGGPPPPPGGDAGGPGQDGGSGGGGDAGSGDGGSGLCSSFTLCNTNADCVGNPAGPTCTPCPACGKHCWGGGSGGGTPADGGSDGGCNTKCVCLYGNCEYNSDYPAGYGCTGAKCKDGGSEVPPKQKAACDAWVGDAGASCSQSLVIPVGTPYNGSGCTNVNVQYMGHSSGDECTNTITSAF